jgi:Kelch motif/Galactose oxidase, central domain
MKKKFYCLFTLQIMVALAFNWTAVQTAKADSFTPTGSMKVARDQFAAVLLTNGLVLVVGGAGTSGYLTNCELYNPTNGTWTLTGSLLNARAGHRLTLLKNGNALVSGGINNAGYVATSELFDPATQTWSVSGNLKTARALHSATLLTNGNVLIAAGTGQNGGLNNAELYNPVLGTWAFTGSMIATHNGPTATLLLDGRVLSAGGDNTGGVTVNTEIYDPSAKTWSAVNSLQTARDTHSAVLLSNGKVLVAGGYAAMSGTVLSSVELYDPATGSWTYTGPMTYSRRALTTTMLPSGLILAAGGDSVGNQAELYNPATAAWIAAGTLMNTPRDLHIAALMPNGKVLIAGGNSGAGPINDAEIYNPETGSVLVTINPTAAVTAGAQWQVDGGVFVNSGSVVSGLGFGTHTISFNAVPGWTTPTNQIVMVTGGTTNVISATYVAMSGSVQVTINPAGATSAGAQWQLDGGAFQSSATILNNVLVGDHTLSFNTVSGWITPSNQTVTVALGATNVVAAAYQPAVGDLQVNIGPAGAVSAGAQWQLDGGAYQNSGTILANVPVGSHAVSFNTVGGWVTPGNIAASVAFNTTNTYSASYTIAPGAVQVTILPTSAVTAGAAWRLDGGTLQASGAVQANVSDGSHTISFVNITGWTTATNQTVSVSPGSTATATGYYTPLDGLQVTITPTCAVSDGAQWQVDGGSFQNSGDTVTNLDPGKHIVSFSNISGWTAPVNQTVTINAGSTTTPTGNYREGSNPGTIVWINAGANRNWSNPTNWDLNRIPTNTDIVLIPHITGTNCILDVNASISGLEIGDCADGGSDGLDLHGKTLVVNGPITIQSSATFTLATQSALIVTNTVITGTVDWQSTMISGTFTLSSNSVLKIDTASNYHQMGNCLFTNYGTVNWSQDILYGGGGSPGTVIYNYGLWNAQDDRALNTTFFGGSIVFDNFGTFRKSGGVNTSQTSFSPDVTFNNTGTLDVQQGNFILQGSGSFTGGFVTTNSTGTMILGSGSYNLNGTTTGTNFLQNGGNLSGTNTINGSLTWLSGSWIGSVTIASNSVVNLLSPSNDHYMGNCLVTNYGTVNWSQDILYAGGSSPATVIYNYGLWNAQDDRTMNHTFFGGNILFENFGIFRKSGGINTSQTSFSFEVTFNNTGTLDVQAGIVNLQGANNLTGGTLRFGFNDLTNYGRLTLNNGNSSVALGGPLKVNVGGTFAPAIGTQFQIVSSFGESGVFSSATLPAGISVNYNNNGAFLLVSGAVPVQILTPQLAGSSFSFQFPTASGQSYTVQGNDDLTTTNWVFYTNIIGSGSLYQFQVPVTATPPHRFFRVSEP